MSTVLQTLRTLSPDQRKGLVAVMARKGVDLFRDLPVSRAGRDGPLPLSHAQQRLWILNRLDPADPAYLVPGVFRLSGPLDPAALDDSLSLLVRRHESLRTAFPERDGGPVQEIRAPYPVRLLRHDLAGLGEEERRARLAALCDAEATTPFDLACGPLLRGRLVRLAAAEHALLLTLHHIVADGWSVDRLMGELAVVYGALADGRTPDLPDLPVQYADFALWQRFWLECGDGDRQLAWWTQRLADDPGPLALPLDRPRPGARRGAGGSVAATLPAELAVRLRRLAESRRVTLAAVLLAAFLALLHRHGAGRDLRVGMPVAGRRKVELEGVVGLFVNTLVVGAAVDGRDRFADLLGRVQDAMLAAQDHQDLPFDRLVEALRPERDAGHSPLVQVLFNHLGAGPAGARDLGPVRLTPVERERTAQKLDLTLTTREDADGGLVADFGYCADILDRAGVEALARRYRALLRQAAGDPARAVGDLDLLEEVEHRQLAAWANPAPLAAVTGVLDLFAAQVARVPGRAAVVQGGRSLSYAALDRRAGRLARRLAAAGAGPGRPVLLPCGRSPEFVVGLLAVLRTGAAAVPLEPDTPAARLARIAALCGAGLVLAAGPVPEVGLPVLGVADDADGTDAGLEPAAVHPRQPAYIVFTSGSTGEPKGVSVPHRALAAYVRGLERRLRLDDTAAMAMASTVAADLGHTVLFGALCAGRTLHLLDGEEARDPLLFREAMARGRIGVLKIAPSHLESLLAEGGESAALPWHALILGGEPCSGALLGRLRAARPDCRLINHYGPTETTVGVLTEEVEGVPAPPATIPLGRPLPQATAWVLDGDLNPLPAGVAGELHIGGPAVADGYVGRPGATAERFVPDPFGAPGARLYRSGDRVRRRPDGRLEFLGRTDQQVKIRGFRVEPGEVEAALRAEDGVRQAVVVVHRDHAGPQLVGYVVGTADPASLRRALRAHLPDHMVPAHILALERLPVTANGKLDRRALPAPAPRTTAAEPPRTATERAVAAVWCAVLGVEHVGRDDDFFDIGGHSLSATQVVSRLRQALAVPVPLRSLFEARRLADFARAVEASGVAAGAAGAAAGTDEPPLRPAAGAAAGEDAAPLSFAQERLWFFAQLAPEAAIYTIPGALRLRGPLDRDALRASLSALVERHPALRTRFAEAAGGPIQVEVPPAPVPLDVVDLAHLPPHAREPALRQHAEAEAQRPFDLALAPLLRAVLIRTAPDDHVLLVTLHHIAADGWSIRILVAELGTLYAGFRAGTPAALPPLPVRCGDVARWQRRRLETGRLDRQLAYWRRHLGTDHRVLELPPDGRRPPPGRGVGMHHATAVDAALTGRLRAFARRRGLTPFMVLLAAFAVVLHQRTGERRVRIGGDIANRNHDRLEGLVGFFVNQLVLQVDVDPAAPAADLLEQCRRVVVDGSDHQDLPFNHLVEALRPPRREGRAPFFSVKLIYQDGVHALPDLPGLTVEPVAAGRHAAEIDLVVAFNNAAETLEARFTWPEGLFAPATVRGLFAAMRAVLAVLVANPGAATADLVAAAGEAGAAASAAVAGPGGAAPSQPLRRAVRAAAAVRHPS
ncbi:amino acid adenylation domain-containing protein [Azospirillum sp. ST 5-10]|uniref:amino acid adenylation domain-containing protein n=1 Tax=unclassified Azospirillum TaxID=2630922 RepID=UPI003F4A310C